LVSTVGGVPDWKMLARLPFELVISESETVAVFPVIVTRLT
jgi:hypothetical protein